MPERHVGDRPVVLVTRVSGIIGSRLAARLAADHRVVGLDVRPPPDELAAVDFSRGRRWRPEASAG